MRWLIKLSKSSHPKPPKSSQPTDPFTRGSDADADTTIMHTHQGGETRRGKKTTSSQALRTISQAGNHPRSLDSKVPERHDSQVVTNYESDFSKDEQLDTIGAPAIPDINKLPIEILGEIATILASIYPEWIWKFAAVCKTWRAAALSTPEAFSYIQLRTAREKARNDRLKYAYFGHLRKPTEVEADIPLWIQRAKACKLNISFEDYNALRFFNLVNNTHETYKDVSIWRHVKRLHFQHLPSDFYHTFTLGSSDDKGILRSDFGELEALSVKYPIHYSTNFSFSYIYPRFPEIAHFFFGCQSQNLSAFYSTFVESKTRPNGNHVTPRLKSLSLEGVEFGSESSDPPLQLSTLTSLRLVGGNTPNASVDFLFQVRANLTDLYLAINHHHLVPGRGLPFIELPCLEQMTLTSIGRHSDPSSILEIFSCPILTHLTCEDTFLVKAELFKINLPRLTHLFIGCDDYGKAEVIQQALPNFGSNLSTLTLFSSSCYSESEINVFVRNMVQAGSIGKGLKVLRFIAVEERARGSMLSNPLLEQWIRWKRKQSEEDADISVQVHLIPSEQAARKSSHWDMNLWWAHDAMWE